MSLLLTFTPFHYFTPYDYPITHCKVLSSNFGVCRILHRAMQNSTVASEEDFAQETETSFHTGWQEDVVVMSLACTRHD